MTAWLLVVGTSLLAIAVWVQTRLNGTPLTTYDIFPLLGLLAFGLLWSHFIVGAVRRYMNIPEGYPSLRRYYSVTGWIVLGLLLLHPGMFIVQLGIDGLGLPPASYTSLYVDTASRVALLLGSISLVAFLLFELHRWLKGKPWWRYISHLSTIAMFAIFYHGLTLGGELSQPWYRVVWVIYFMLFVGALVYTGIINRRERNE